MASLATLSRNISWNYVDAAANLVIYFLLTPIVVAHLGATGFGIWVLLNAILYYLQFLDLGFNNALVKYVAEYGERGAWRRVNLLVGSTTTVLMHAGFLALLLSGAVAYWVVPHFFNVPVESIPEFQLAVVLIGVQLLIGFPLSVLDTIYEGCHRFDVLSGIGLVCRVISAVAIVICLKLGFGVVGLVCVQIFATLFQASIFILLMPRLLPGVRFRLHRMRGRLYRKIRAYSGWTSLNELITEGSSELEKLIIPLLLTVSLVTPYTLVCTVAAVIFMAVEPITTTFFPLSSAYDARDDKQRLRELLQRGSKLVMAISLPLAVAVICYGEPFIDIWIGEEHVVVPQGVMQLVVLSFTTTSFVMTGGIILLALARVREVFWMTVSELVLVLVLVLLLTPSHGLVGLAASLLIANVGLTFLCTIPYVCRLLEQSVAGYLWGSLLRPLLAVVPAFLTAYWLDSWLDSITLFQLIVKSGLIGLVYLVTFWLVSLSSAERAMSIEAGEAIWSRLRSSGGTGVS